MGIFNRGLSENDRDGFYVALKRYKSSVQKVFESGRGEKLSEESFSPHN